MPAIADLPGQDPGGHHILAWFRKSKVPGGIALSQGLARGTIVMILQLPSVGLSSRSRPDSPAFVINKACRSSATTNCGYRLLKISLAIYLVPALLVVLIVGAIGAFVRWVRAALLPLLRLIVQPVQDSARRLNRAHRRSCRSRRDRQACHSSGARSAGRMRWGIQAGPLTRRKSDACRSPLRSSPRTPPRPFHWPCCRPFPVAEPGP